MSLTFSIFRLFLMNDILLLLIFSGVKKETERKNDDLNPTYSEVIVSLKV